VSLAQAVYGQFRKPNGLLGRLAGAIMAARGSNRQRNAWTIELLGLRPDDRFLEIGFGPGLSLALASKTITKGAIVGIDHSETMHRAATVRNAEAIRSGRVTLMTGGLELLDGLDEPFTKVMSANVVQFWGDGAAAFGKIAGVMAPGGTVATTYQPRHRGATAADAETMAARITGWMEAAGFRNIRIERLPLDPMPVISVLGTKA
jgi:cyclopropane fatty-acyl-phospholipid synthase-like methyltransferase